MNEDVPSTAASDKSATKEVLRINSQDLFQGRNLIEIEHQQEIYRLRLTRLGKLILTK